jgi:hypothetical protein
VKALPMKTKFKVRAEHMLLREQWASALDWPERLTIGRNGYPRFLELLNERRDWLGVSPKEAL